MTEFCCVKAPLCEGLSITVTTFVSYYITAKLVVSSLKRQKHVLEHFGIEYWALGCEQLVGLIHKVNNLDEKKIINYSAIKTVSQVED